MSIRFGFPRSVLPASNPTTHAAPGSKALALLRRIKDRKGTVMTATGLTTDIAQSMHGHIDQYARTKTLWLDSSSLYQVPSRLRADHGGCQGAKT